MLIWRLFAGAIWLARLVSVVVLFVNPLLAIALSLVLDVVDSFFAYEAGYTWPEYTRLDKLFDLWWYVAILIYARHLTIFPVLSVLFLFRLIGQLIAIVTRSPNILFWFPNVFENYFFIYVLVLVFLPGYLPIFSGIGLLPLLIALVTKLPQEYWAHKKGVFYSPTSWPKTFGHTPELF